VSDATVAAESCEAIAAGHQQFEAFAARDVTLGPLSIVRALPVKGKRPIDPWCFLDRFGPVSFSAGPLDGERGPRVTQSRLVDAAGSVAATTTAARITGVMMSTSIVTSARDVPSAYTRGVRVDADT
jgi:hypothetical protein